MVMPIGARITAGIASAAAALAVIGVAGGEASPAAATTPSGCVKYVYSQGGSGTCVKYIQELLNFHHQEGDGSTIVATDGAYGPLTKASVVGLQQHFHLTVDGIVGPQTWQYLCNAFEFSTSALNAVWSAAGCNSILQ